MHTMVMEQIQLVDMNMGTQAFPMMTLSIMLYENALSVNSLVRPSWLLEEWKNSGWRLRNNSLNSKQPTCFWVIRIIIFPRFGRKWNSGSSYHTIGILHSNVPSKTILYGRLRWMILAFILKLGSSPPAIPSSAPETWEEEHWRELSTFQPVANLNERIQRVNKLQ